MKSTPILVVALLVGLCPGSILAQSNRELESARRTLVEEAIVAAGIRDERVIKSMQETWRHEFVDRKFRKQAYLDMALPIGAQQTISSPFIVAFMTESLDPQPTDRVLEIGTGSGYQAAVLSPLVREVYTIEIVPSLGKKAQQVLRKLGYKNVFTRIGDGYQGWAEKDPFDKIIVTCSPEKIPVPLVTQLREGGLMIIPVGERYQQTLYLMRKKNGKLVAEALRPTLFVPMTGVAESRRQVQPDGTSPVLLNPSFEEKLPDNGFVPGWYYQRALKRVSDVKSPDGMYHITFENDQIGAPAHLLQGMAMDGKTVKVVELSAWTKFENIQRGLTVGEQPVVALTFYDENRRDLGTRFLGPFRGSSDWYRQASRFQVPRDTHEAIVRIGLFGATGKISFDNVELKKIN